MQFQFRVVIINFSSTWLKLAILISAILFSACTNTIIQETPAPVEAVSVKEPQPRDTSSANKSDGLSTQISAVDGQIWARIVNGYGLSPVPSRYYAKQLQRYLKNKAGIVAILARGEPYFFYIVEQVEARGLPSELALLPVIESAFEPRAYSPVNAAGLWQFLPSTGQYLGLKQNWWVDMRLDVVASTDGALEYLTALNQQFDNNWNHSLVAYNVGPSALRRHLRRKSFAYDNPDKWYRGLPRETQQYLPKLYALAEIVKHPQKYQIKLPEIANEPVFEIVEVPGQIEIARAAELADLTVEQLTELNPGVRRWATAPNGPHRLILPIAHAETFKVNLQSIERSELTTWHRHKVAWGETLGHLALRYDTTKDVIKRANGLTDHRIAAGRYLLVPQTQTIDSHVVHDCHGEKVIHTVQVGDTLWDLSKTYKTPIQRIRNCNLLAQSTLLKPNQKLTIWVN